MMTPSWLITAVGAICLLSVDVVSARGKSGLRQPASPGYRGRDSCPVACSIAGPNPSNWSVYHNFEQLQYCDQTLFYDFSLYDRVDDPSTLHRLRVCTSYGPDWSSVQRPTTKVAAAVESLSLTYSLGWWGDGILASTDISSISKQMRHYMKSQHVASKSTKSNTFLFARSGSAAVGIYVGKGLQSEGVSSFALKAIVDNIRSLNIASGNVAMQLCDPNSNNAHTFGIFASSNGTFTPVQDAMKTWSKGGCVSFDSTKNITGPAVLTTPPLKISANSTRPKIVLPSSSRATVLTPSLEGNLVARASCSTKQVESGDSCAALATKCGLSPADFLKYNPATNFCSTITPGQRVCCSSGTLPTRSLENKLVARAECSTKQVEGGDSCAALATKCGISAADFTKYNPATNFCSTLKPGQHVCCSSGTMPDFAPKPNADGSCATYTIQPDDNCADLAAQYSLTTQDLEDFNTNTWGWNGCSNVWVDSIICLSKGNPPMPAPMANAVCGPQKPGTEAPKDTTNITNLNPCPLNACCNVWGQCGTTDDFCTVTSTGAPGSAKKGTNGCISNCGTEIVRGSAPDVVRRIAYFEGYSMSSRDCLYQDASQIDGSQYTHLHFGFGELTADYQIKFQDVLTEYQFKQFLRVSGPKKILSFGGWDFSTLPATYNIFRQGVKAANRLTLATNIANFVKSNYLDGVDIDWEYPGAPDIPGIPPDDEDSGDNYLAFLVILKNLLPGKSVSIAAASSYFYLRNFPIEKISKVVDYIIYMTYDLHGQWDAENPNSQIGCPSGMCLRSQVNLTETINSLVMITKAGVSSNKVVVGVTSYGRSFAMADSSCHGPDCLFTGGPYDSQASPGRCTATGGYISDAEIREIVEGSTQNGILKRDGRVNEHYVDPVSASNILIYDGNQWVAYMDADTKAKRKVLYDTLNMGGTTDWATDLQDYHPVPLRGGQAIAATWADYFTNIKSGLNPWQLGNRTGNWTEVTCGDRSVSDVRYLSPSERWTMIDAPHAWADAIEVWKNVDRKEKKMTFTASLSTSFNGPPNDNCGTLLDKGGCNNGEQCKEFDNDGTGAAGWMIWDSLVTVHQMFSSYKTALVNAAATEITNSLDDLENKFSPIPEPEDNTWLLLLIDLVTLGASGVAAPFFNSVLSKMPYFIAKGGSLLDNTKDTTMTLISQSTTIAKDLLEDPDEKDWTPAKQDSFTNYMGQSLKAWGEAVEKVLQDLFSGEDSSISMLTDIISDGKLVAGSGYSLDRPGDDDSQSALETAISRSFYAFSIPTLWSVAGKYPFVIDAGYDCDHDDDMSDYLSKDDISLTKTCYRNKRYYFGMPEGEPYDCYESVCDDSKFSVPAGTSSLGKGSFGNVTLEDLIVGSVRTYLQNGEKNGGGIANPNNGGTLDELFNNDITTPGYIRIPVCSAENAYKAWTRGKDSDDNVYPCGVYQGQDLCGTSTYVDQTSGASPTVADCMQLVKNIAGKDFNHEVENAIGSQHQLDQHGTCAFGVQAIGKNGNVDFYIGNKDMVDIITESVKQFGGSGKVGAKGEVSCQGTVKGQKVEWGIYHN